MEIFTRSRKEIALSTNSQKISSQRMRVAPAPLTRMPQQRRGAGHVCETSENPRLPDEFHWLGRVSFQNRHDGVGYNLAFAGLQHERIQRKGFTLFSGAQNNRWFPLSQRGGDLPGSCGNSLIPEYLHVGNVVGDIGNEELGRNARNFGDL